MSSIKFYLIQLLSEQQKIDNDNTSSNESLDLSQFLLLALVSPIVLPIVLPFFFIVLILLFISSIFDVLYFKFRDYPKTITAGIALIVLYLSILIFVTSIYRWEGFSITLIVIIGVQFIFYCAKKQTQLKEIKSLLYKLNTQWKE